MTDTTDIAALRVEIDTPGIGSVAQLRKLAHSILDKLEAERKRADELQTEVDRVKQQSRNRLQGLCKAGDERDKAEAELAALKGDQVPVGKFAGWGLYRESTDDFGSWLHTKPRDENDYALTQAGYVNVRLFTAPQKPVVSEGLIQLKEAVDFYLQVQKDNPPIEQGMHKDADEWLKRAAIEAAGGVVKDGE